MRTLFPFRNIRVISVPPSQLHTYTSRVCNVRYHKRTSLIAPAAYIRHGLAGSMATAASILAVARAAAPQIRSRQDQLVFALHAAVLASGYRLVAVAEDAQLEGLQSDAPDVPLTGWNSSSDAYSLAYVSEDESAQNPPAGQAAAAPAAPIKLLLKALVMGDSTLIACLATDTPAAQPQTVELSVDDYISSSSSSNGGGSSSSAAAAGQAGPLVAKTYKNLDQLAQQVNKALGDITAAAVGSSSGGSSGVKRKSPTSAEAGKQQGEAGSGANPGQQGSRPAQPQPPQQQEPDPDYDPLRIGPPRRPLRVGADDIMPLGGGGGLGGLGGMGGGMLPPGPGGGMHVGPGHPFFADRMRHPDVMPGRGGLRGPPGPGGMRWDPINPEGLEGWRPEDFQRPRPGGGRGQPDINPDIGLPGPGRGTDWDYMYG